jgi:F-type H+-transporting ATPase subunit b
MGSLIETFHINWQLIIAQMVNFAIVFAVLWFFALKPLIKTMRERSNTIEKSLNDARKIEENLRKSEEGRVVKIIEAKEEAQKIIEQAGLQAEKNKTETIAKAKEEVNKVVLQGKEQIVNEKDKMLKDIKLEVSDLVVLTTEKLLSKVLDKKIDKKLVEETLKEIK